MLKEVLSEWKERMRCGICFGGGKTRASIPVAYGREWIIGSQSSSDLAPHIWVAMEGAVFRTT